ncbi:hypothetical protein KI387_019186, partial [Taxus chinensis]
FSVAVNASGMRCTPGCCGFSFFGVLSFLMFGFLVWVIIGRAYPDSKPKFYAEEAAVEKFHLTSTSFDISIQLQISIRNFNKKGGVTYDALRIDAYYGGERIAWSEVLPKFYQRHKNTTVLHPVLQSKSLNISAVALKNLGEDKVKAWAEVEVTLNSRVRFRSLVKAPYSDKMTVKCPISLSLNNTANSFKLKANGMRHTSYWIFWLPYTVLTCLALGFLVWVFIGMANTDSKKPKFYAEAAVNNFHLTNSRLDMSIQLEINIRNANKKGTIIYDGMQVTAYYRGRRIGWSEILTKFQQRHKNTTILRPPLKSDSLNVSEDAVKNMGEDQLKGWAEVEVLLNSRVRFKTVVNARFSDIMEVKCPISLSLGNRTTNSVNRAKCAVALKDADKLAQDAGSA